MRSWIPLLNTFRPKQNGRHFSDDIFSCIFLNENVWILNKISLKFVSRGQMNNIPALVQIMAWRRPGEQPLSEPLKVSLLRHICVTRSNLRSQVCYPTVVFQSLQLIIPVVFGVLVKPFAASVSVHFLTYNYFSQLFCKFHIEKSFSVTFIYSNIYTHNHLDYSWYINTVFRITLLCWTNSLLSTGTIVIIFHMDVDYDNFHEMQPCRTIITVFHYISIKPDFDIISLNAYVSNVIWYQCQIPTNVFTLFLGN